MSLDCKKPEVCLPPDPPKPHPPTPPFDLCIALDWVLRWDGTHATVERVKMTPDGTYDTITTVNGCIAGVGYGNIPTYTPPYCNPNPADCQQGGGDGSARISNQSGNIIINNGDGLYARTYVQGGAGISVTGVGTVNDPYIVSGGSGGGSGVQNIAGRDGISTEVDSNRVAYVGLLPTGVQPGTFRGLTIGIDGRVYSYDPNLDGAGVKAGRGLEQHNEQDTVVIEHPQQLVPSALSIGGWNISVNDSGHWTSATQVAAPVADGCYMVGGTEICFTNGIATSIGAGNGGGGGGNGGAPAPGALRDMIRVDLASTGATGTRIEYFGQRLQLTFDNPGQLRVQVPGYVTDISQVSANSTAGNCTASIDPGSGNLVVRYGGQASVDAQVITIAFRG